MVPVDITNPGQFFACCGLLELADRLWPGVQGWFEIKKLQSDFQIATAREANLKELLSKAAELEFDLDEGGTTENEDDSSEKEDKLSVNPIVIRSPIKLRLDWWSDKSTKPWAGSMNERSILRAMLRAINSESPDPLNDSKVAFDFVPDSELTKKRKPKKREPFYFDSRRGYNAHPLDSGFSPDSHNMASNCFPAVEAMCFVGLQRVRPSPTEVPNRSRYVVWTDPMPANAIAPIASGLVPVRGSLTFSFDNFFRTDQRKHKSYSPATLERRNNV